VEFAVTYIMPVRIYEIAKELNLESKAVLAKAKELGISAAKVPSSSLDKITAEYLKEQLTPMSATAAPAPAPAVDEPVVILRPPPAPAPVEAPVEIIAAAPEPPPAPPVAAAPAPVAAVATPEAVASATEVPAASTPPASAPAAATPPPSPTPTAVASAAPVAPAAPSAAVAPAPAAPAAPPAPVVPPKTQIGQLVGRVDLKSFAPRQPARPEARPAARTDSRPAARSDDRRGPPDRRGPYGQQQRGPAQAPAPARPAAPPRQTFAANAPLIIMRPPILVRELAEKMGRKPFQVIADLMSMGVFATVTQSIEAEHAIRVCAKHGIRFETEKRDKATHVVNVPQAQTVELDQEDSAETLKPRPPVITIMGHVDHGKTSLLDVIRKASVAAGEAGGITQHIGAYTISYPHPVTGALTQLTFLDTPGHAAFSAMRARGANVTDIVVLVVAANDGVMPQTLEALAHAQAAKVPIIVAVNKCDHPNANPLKVRQQLQDKGLVPDDWGGDTLYVDCSALTKLGIDKLIDSILLQAELLELKANPDRNAKGNVIESGIEAGGPVVTVLVRKGTLHVGDIVLCGEHYGKVRAMMNEEGTRLKEATPSVAVRVLGLNGIPEAGSEFSAVEDEKAARDLAEERFTARKKTELEGVRPRRQTLEDIFGQIKDMSAKVLKVIVKADTQGSVEAICDALNKIDSSKVALEILHDAVGAVSSADVLLASSSNAVILGFHTRVDNSAAEQAKHEGVQIKLYAIIYELIDQVKEAMSGLLDPLLKEVVIGQAEVRKIFSLSKGGNIAGCAVTNGRLVRGKMRVRRRNNVIYEGVSLTLKRFQDEVNEVRSGMECGIRLDGYDDFIEGDILECYTLEKVAQKL
jgi:translation initiation factor IF-2